VSTELSAPELDLPELDLASLGAPMRGPEIKEGVRARAEKRPPKF